MTYQDMVALDTEFPLPHESQGFALAYSSLDQISSQEGICQHMFHCCLGPCKPVRWVKQNGVNEFIHRECGGCGGCDHLLT